MVISVAEVFFLFVGEDIVIVGRRKTEMIDLHHCSKRVVELQTLTLAWTHQQYDVHVLQDFCTNELCFA